jgi:aminoglycoside phosphotransferase family enzyme/predicted kinase
VAQAPLIAAMSEPAFYPQGPSEIGHVETHISHLFFVGELVYKVKKAVRFSFLDYSTPGKRRFCLQEELRLNRRLAPSVYLGVLPISHEAGGWQLGSSARPVDYTLVMRRLPEKRMLDFLLGRACVTPEMMRAVAETLVPFHAAAATGGRISGAGNPLAIKHVWEENLADIRPFVGRLLDPASFEALSRFGPCFVARHRDLLVYRVLEGRIRELHGDLHCGHICFAPEGIQIFDCVEFNPRLRNCDVASEIAFLVMDMESRGAKELAQAFLERYLELANDQAISLLLPFYKCHRALVRGKVEALRSGGASPLALRYFDYACRVRWEAMGPFLIAISGLTGSGKSTLAAELTRRLGVRTISSDATRKALTGLKRRQDQVGYEEGIYRPSITRRTYEKMSAEAEKLLLRRQGVILDATFHRRAQREALSRLAAKHRAPLAFVHCESADGVVEERLKRRTAEGQDLSDGRWEVYLKQKTALEPFEEVPREAYLRLDTEADVAELCGRVEPFLQRLFLRQGGTN